MNNANAQTQPQRTLSLVEISSLINRYIADIDRLRGSLKTEKQMFEDNFKNDANFHQQEEKISQLNKQLQAMKQQMTKQPSAEASQAKINQLRVELKDMQSALSQYLQEYQRIAGTNIIESDDGTIREIVHSYRLVKKSKS